ncbi:hypothetical protein KPL28_03385 [Clostridium algidicarnis]|uniref:hypothetical protein n=1 Tax=Clostridium algidicarnis TaxID=37659 RepID=UPI001C0C7BA7|nr:hypothetical protein [Clostridium algidicarnis]MBU3208679.1 hypothetical protein [Clostridium algidicarnis]
MAYIKTTWKNKIVERPRTFRQQQNADGTVTLIPSEGAVIETGTPINAQNMNKIEDALGSTDRKIDDFIATKGKPNGLAGLDPNGLLSPIVGELKQSILPLGNKYLELNGQEVLKISYQALYNKIGKEIGELSILPSEPFTTGYSDGPPSHIYESNGVAAGRSRGAAYICKDGLIFTGGVRFTNERTLRSFLYCNGKYIIGVGGFKLYTSTDLVIWEEIWDRNGAYYVFDDKGLFSFENGIYSFCTISEASDKREPRVYKTTDFVNFTFATTNLTDNRQLLNNCHLFKGKFLSHYTDIGGKTYIMSSVDKESWALDMVPFKIDELYKKGEMLIALDKTTTIGGVRTSTDGKNWSIIKTPEESNVLSISFFGNMIFFIMTNGNAYYTYNFLDYIKIETGSKKPIGAVCINTGLLITEFNTNQKIPITEVNKFKLPNVSNDRYVKTYIKALEG